MQIATRNRWERVGISFASALAAEVIVCAGLACLDGPRPQQMLSHMLFYLFFASIFVVPGWLVALPIILQTRFERLRVWLKILIGTLIGPAIMVAFGIYRSVGFAYDKAVFFFLYVAAGISFLTSAIYLSVLKYFSETRIQTLHDC
jgi:hypothetical protein